MDEVKSGVLPSEFWKSLAVTVAGLALIGYGIVKGNDIALQYGVMLSGVSSAGYAISRGLSKKG